MEMNRVEDRREPDRSDGRAEEVDPRLLATLRAALAAVAQEQPAASAPPRPSEDRVPLFWKMFGATLLSVSALVAITLYTQMISDLNHMRSELHSLRERSNLVVTKEDYNGRNIAIAATVKEMQAANKEALAYWKERSQTQERQIKAIQEDTRQAVRALESEVQRLRERLIALEQREASPPAPLPKSKR